MRVWLALPSLLFTLASCSVKATLILSPTGAAEATASFSVSPEAQAAWSNLRELDATLPADPLASSALRKSLGPQSQVSTGGGLTTVSLPVTDLGKYLTWKKDDQRWEGTIDRSVVRRWVGLTGWAGSPAVDSFLPAPGATVTEAEYRDLLVYLLGPGTPEPAARVLVDSSVFQLTLVAPKTLTSAPGAASVKDKTAVYRWPLVRVLTLEKPLVVTLNF